MRDRRDRRSLVARTLGPLRQMESVADRALAELGQLRQENARLQAELRRLQAAQLWDAIDDVWDQTVTLVLEE